KGSHPPSLFLGLIPERLRLIITEAGYDYDSVVSTWADRGWLLVDKSDRAGRYHQATINGERPRLIAIKRQVIEKLRGQTGEPSTSELGSIYETCGDFLMTAAGWKNSIGNDSDLDAAIKSIQEFMNGLKTPPGLPTGLGVVGTQAGAELATSV